MNTETTSAVPPWQHYRMTRFLVLSWLELVISAVVLMWCGNTLLHWDMRWKIAGIFGTMIGSFFLILIIPWISLCYDRLRLRQVRVWVGWLLMGLPCCSLVGYSLWLVLTYMLPQFQPGFFETRTGKSWPANAHLLARRHTLLLADSEHIWFFESEPREFEQFSQRGDWKSIDTNNLNWDLLSQRFPWEAVEVPGSGKWVPVEFWEWDAGKDARFGPFGPIYLMVDQEHRRWCVWYDGI